MGLPWRDSQKSNQGWRDTMKTNPAIGMADGRMKEQRPLKEAQRAIVFEALNDDDVFSIHRVAGLSPLAFFS